MTNRIEQKTIDGLTLCEHRELGRAFSEIADALDLMSLCASEGRRSEYEHMSMEVDLILDECAGMFLDAYREVVGEECDNSIYPYPRFAVGGTMLPDLPSREI